MTSYLLDTNVISELTRNAPAPEVVSFLTEQDDLWLSAVVVHELEYGLRLLPQGRRRTRLSEMQSGILAAYGNRILPLDTRGAVWAAHFRAEARRFGRPLDLGDALIAGTAKAHAMTLATRNVADFEQINVEVVNPWDLEPPLTTTTC